MTRYIVIWHPGFESGMSRMETIDTLKSAWSAKAPQLVARRKVEMKASLVQDLFDEINGWLQKHYKKSMAKRPLSIVAISDPIWADSEETWRTSHTALSAGYAMGGGKPQHCVLAYEGELT